MADQQTDAPAPTEAEVKEANEIEDSKWSDDFPEEQLKVPSKSEEVKPEPKATEAPKEDEPGEEPAEYEDPEPVVTVDDPGDYKPKDFSFEVTLADGKTKTVKTIEDAEILADDPDNFETPKQLLDFIRKSQKMENKLEKDRETWEAQKTEFETQSQEEGERLETVNNYASEFDYLAQKGLIPKLSHALQNADWRDPEVAKNKDIKIYNDILDYLVKENQVRDRAKVKRLTSIVDAFNAWQLDSGRQKKEEATKAAGEARKAAGAKVAGVSPSQQGSYVPKGIAVGNPNVFKRDQAVWDN